MNNTVILTDDELSIIATALTFVKASHVKYIQENAEVAIDPQTSGALEAIDVLLERLNKEFF